MKSAEQREAVLCARGMCSLGARSSSPAVWARQNGSHSPPCQQLPVPLPGPRTGGRRAEIPTLCGRAGLALAEALGKNTEMSRGGKCLHPEHPGSEHQMPALWGLGHGQRAKPRFSELSMETLELLEGSTAGSAVSHGHPTGTHKNPCNPCPLQNSQAGTGVAAQALSPAELC